MKAFYENYFGARANQKCTHLKKGFEPYFLGFDNGPRLELMKMASAPLSCTDPYQQATGITHLAFSAGSEAEVDRLTKVLNNERYQVVSEPRKTGDGYYETLVLDLENNRIETTS